MADEKANDQAKNREESEAENERKNQPQLKATPVWEWVIAAVGFILVVASLGTSVYRAIVEESTPPILEISVGSITPTTGGYLVTFVVKNSGKQTAANLTVEGELKSGADSAETSSTSLTYAPADSRREGGLFFAKNPNEYKIELRAKGYEKP